MINQSDTRRLVESALKRAISLKVDSLPNVDPKEVIAEFVGEFNKWFDGVYKIDQFKFTKDYLDIKVVKDKSGADDFGDEELIHA